MAEYFVDPNLGNDNNDGLSVLSPWKLIPGQTGANSVVSGDIINVKNGTVSRNRIIVPANNLTYRGYGIAQNKLRLTLSLGSKKQTVDVFRSQGSHEGMWTLDGTNDPASIGVTGYFTFFTRSGCVLEDCEIIAPQASTAVSLGPSNSTAIGVTMRRCRVVGSAATGITIYSRQAVLEDIQVIDTDDDAITIGATTLNGNRAGYTDTLSRISIVNPGKDIAAFLGDAIQTLPNSGAFESNLVISNLYVKKDNAVKQAIVFNDGTGTISLSDFFFESSLSGHAQILLSGVKGRIDIKNGRVLNGCADNAFIRLGESNGIALDTNAEINVYNCIVNASKNAGFFTAASPENAATFDGHIKIYNCLIQGENIQSLSYSGMISVAPGAVLSIGANAKLTSKNNFLIDSGTNPVFVFPSGNENSSKWTINNNAILSSSICASFGSSIYETVSEFESAHSNASSNLSAINFLFNSQGRLLTDSVYQNAGETTNNTHDQEKNSFSIPPPIGPFTYISPRTMRS